MLMKQSPLRKHIQSGQVFPDQDQFLWRTLFRLTMVGGLTTVASALILIMCFFLSGSKLARLGKFIGLSSSFLVLVQAAQNFEARDELQEYYHDLDDISSTAWASRMFQYVNPTIGMVKPGSRVEDEIDNGPPFVEFNWDTLRNVSTSKVPHLMIEAGTGGGKTVLTEWILSMLGGASFVLTPKMTPNQWKGLSVVGVPFQFDEIADCVENLYFEMKDRYDAINRGFGDDFPLINVVLEEWPTVASSTGEMTSDYMSKLVRVARESKIRLIIITQGSEVKTLGMEGEGSLRDSFRRIRLGDMALDYAKSLKNKEMYRFLKKQKRPAMFADQPCNVPEIDLSVDYGFKPFDYKSIGQTSKRAREIHLLDMESIVQSFQEQGIRNEKELIIRAWEVAYDPKSMKWKQAKQEFNLVMQRMASKNTL